MCISGVKKNSPTDPEQCWGGNRHVADDGKNSNVDINAEYGGVGETNPTKLSEADAEESLADSSAEARNSVNPAGELSKAEKDDIEFLALIKGRYREAYKRRTESIIRKRLKSSKVKNASVVTAALKK